MFKPSCVVLHQEGHLNDDGVAVCLPVVSLQLAVCPLAG